MDESAAALHERCAAQISDLHEVIENWLTARPRWRSAGASRGRCDIDSLASSLTGRAEPASFAAFDAAHAPGFTMVTPEGALLTRDQLLPGFGGAHGSAPGLSIRIAEVAVVHADATGVVATYEEWQDGPAGRSGRRSTVLLVRDAAAPHGLRSRHLHETWISRGR